MKKKTKKALIILLCVVAVLAALGFAAYNIALDYVQNKMISSVLDTMIDSGEITLSELEIIASEETPPEVAAPDVTEPETTETEPFPPQDAPAVSEKPATEPSTEMRVEIVDKATQKIADSITREDKYAMVRLITSHLTSADIKYLAGLLAGGLTRDERLLAYRLAKQRFSGEELNTVREYYHRYKAQIMAEPDLPAKK